MTWLIKMSSIGDLNINRWVTLPWTWVKYPSYNASSSKNNNKQFWEILKVASIKSNLTADFILIHHEIKKKIRKLCFIRYMSLSSGMMFTLKYILSMSLNCQQWVLECDVAMKLCHIYCRFYACLQPLYFSFFLAFSHIWNCKRLQWRFSLPYPVKLTSLSLLLCPKLRRFVSK